MQALTWRELHELASVVGSPVKMRARYNLAPGQDAAVIRMGEEGRRLDMLRWGLIPGWAKDSTIANKLINARVETAAEKPSYRNAWRTRRCLIPVNGYYEWTGAGKVRQPWLIRRRDEAPLFIAGLWESWRIREDDVRRGRFVGHEPQDLIETFTVITTEANGDVSSIHHRMPVFLESYQFEAWLTGPPIVPAPLPPETLEARTVSTRVNSPRNDDPECLISSPVLL